MKFVGQLLGQHCERYPQMQLADIYKLLHQAAMGPGHMVAGTEQVRAKLDEELRALSPGPTDPLLDPISPDGQLVRVHLRPYVAAGHDIDTLATALVETAQRHRPAADRLAKFCGCLGDLAEAGGIPFARAEVEPFMLKLQAEAFPVVHHSTNYREAYRPAYRVVDIALLGNALR
jgi:hypothetical protein